MTIRGPDFADRQWVAALAPPLAVRLYSDPPETAVQRLLLLAVSLGVVYAWAALFARSGGRPLGRGLPAFAMTFVLLLPAGVAWDSAVVALSFGAVFGREIFGGRPPLPPALIGLSFAIFSFPDGGFETDGVLARSPDVLFAAACLPGAAAVGLLMGDAEWWQHPGLGTFAAGVLFMAAVSGNAGTGQAARWLHGLLVGALIAMIRLATPEHPDGVISAVLLGALFAPLVDRVLSWRSSHG